METIRSFKTLANIYQSTRHNFPEALYYQQHCRVSFIYRIITIFIGKSSSQGQFWNSRDFVITTKSACGPCSSVGIATRNGLDSPGIESRWGRDFLNPSRPALGPTQPPVQRLPRLFLRGKTTGAWRWPPIPFSAEVKERVQLYLYSPSGFLWPVLGWNVPLTLQNLQICVWEIHNPQVWWLFSRKTDITQPARTITAKIKLIFLLHPPPKSSGHHSAEVLKQNIASSWGQTA
jgi:hypothetical protein